eukprot:5176136-Pleurochrysis_carterae.AAC.2
MTFTRYTPSKGVRVCKTYDYAPLNYYDKACGGTSVNQSISGVKARRDNARAPCCQSHLCASKSLRNDFKGHHFNRIANICKSILLPWPRLVCITLVFECAILPVPGANLHFQDSSNLLAAFCKLEVAHKYIYLSISERPGSICFRIKAHVLTRIMYTHVQQYVLAGYMALLRSRAVDEITRRDLCASTPMMRYGSGCHNLMTSKISNLAAAHCPSIYIQDTT